MVDTIFYVFCGFQVGFLVGTIWGPGLIARAKRRRP